MKILATFLALVALTAGAIGQVVPRSAPVTPYLALSNTTESLQFYDIMAYHPNGTVIVSDAYVANSGQTMRWATGSVTDIGTITGPFMSLNWTNTTAPRNYWGVNLSGTVRPYRQGGAWQFVTSGQKGPIYNSSIVMLTGTNIYAGSGTGTTLAIDGKNLTHIGFDPTGYNIACGNITAGFTPVASGTWAPAVPFGANAILGFDIEFTGSNAVTVRAQDIGNPATLCVVSATSSALVGAGGNTAVWELYVFGFPQGNISRQYASWVTSSTFTSFAKTMENVERMSDQTALDALKIDGSTALGRAILRAKDGNHVSALIGQSDTLHRYGSGTTTQLVESTAPGGITFSQSNQDVGLSGGLNLQDSTAASGTGILTGRRASVHIYNKTFSISQLDDDGNYVGKNWPMINWGGAWQNGAIMTANNFAGTGLAYNIIPAVPGGQWRGELFGGVTIDILPIMTSNTTASVTFNTGGTNQTVYNSSASTIVSGTIALPSASSRGQTVTYTTAGAITTLTVTGSIITTTSPTTLAIGGVLQWQAINTSGVWTQTK